MKRPDSNSKKKTATETEAETLSGTVEHVVFHSEESGYTVCHMQVPGHSGLVTVVGNCPAIWDGEMVTCSGQWDNHRIHGHQFAAGSIRCVPPTSARGIERYLGSGMIRGIGKVNAQRLVKHFGDNTLRIIEHESKRLEEVEGIGPKRRRMIRDSWVEQKAIRDIMIFLQGHGMGTAQSARIFRNYGENAVAIITENPYRLCSDIWGIGFKTADSVAHSLGIPKDSDQRARAGLVYVLQTLTDEGHCYCPLAELVLLAQDLLDIPAETVENALVHEIQREAIVQEADRIYLKTLYDAECTVAQRITKLQNTAALFRPIIADKAVAWAQERMQIEFAPSQHEALRMALSEKVSVITGGPGVGKTTIIRALTDVFKARRIPLALAAPTGRAAKRMSEATGTDAITVHRLLKYQPATRRFEFDRANPLPFEVLILDEVSMIDLPLMHSILQALPDTACLVMVGDADQLPSVGPGNVLRDMMLSDMLPVCRLNTIYRQAEGSWIVRNAHHINRGEQLELPPEGANADFYFMETNTPEVVIDRVINLVTRRIPRRFSFDPLNDIQVLTPMRRGQLGTENLNIVMQDALNPAGESLERFGRSYRDGDRMMQIRNNYDKDVYNGDIGRISAVDRVDQTLVVDYDGRKVKYELSELDELIHAYACSIHKSQGSEYPVAVILLATQHFKLLQRNLLYTAITRGKKLVCLVGSAKAVGLAIRNNEIRLRKTTLRDRIAARI